MAQTRAAQLECCWQTTHGYGTGYYSSFSGVGDAVSLQRFRQTPNRCSVPLLPNSFRARCPTN